MSPDLADLRNADWRELLATAQSRTRLEHSGKSGAQVDRVTLASGLTVVVKQSSPDADWLAKVTRDDGRIVTLWESGVFDRLPPSIDHTILAILKDENGWQLIMRDVGGAFPSDQDVLSREQVDKVLAAADDLHRVFWGQRFEGACPLDDYLNAYVPVWPERVPGWSAAQEAHWNEFQSRAPQDMIELLDRARVDNVSFFSRIFDQCEPTLIHGDLFPPNVGFLDRRVVLIDWSFATFAPAAFEIAFFLLWSECGWCASLGIPREEVLERYQVIADDRFDPHALSIGLISAFALCGVGLRNNPHALEWWTSRIRTELKRTRLT